MMGFFIKFNSLLLLIVFSSTYPYKANALEAPVIPREYNATYQVLHNGNDLAEVTVRFTRQGDTWVLHGFTHDTRGLADVLNVQGTQTTTGSWQDGRFVPDNYSFSFSLIGYKSTWNAKFDWSSGTVTSSGKSWVAHMPLTGDASDPLSLSLNIRTLLDGNQDQMSISVVDEDKIRQQVFQADRTEAVDTALGCLDTTRIKRVRRSAKRTSMFWYANDHDYIPVQIRHARKNGNDFRLKIISLDVGGQQVHPVEHC